MISIIVITTMSIIISSVSIVSSGNSSSICLYMIICLLSWTGWPAGLSPDLSSLSPRRVSTPPSLLFVFPRCYSPPLSHDYSLLRTRVCVNMGVHAELDWHVFTAAWANRCLVQYTQAHHTTFPHALHRCIPVYVHTQMHTQACSDN